jgi:hypothetical protein
MTACYNNSAVVGCHTDAGGALIPVVIHYTYDNAGAPALRITNAAGVVVVGATAANTVAGACAVPAVIVTGGGAQIAGPTRSGAGLAFNGAADTWDTSVVPNKLHSLTIAARAVSDGLPGNTANQVTIIAPDGTNFNMMNGETRTFSVTRDQDDQLRRDYRVQAFGNAYANITYTFFA